VLIAAGIATCAVVIWAAVRVAASVDSLSRSADDVRVRLVPLLDKADVTVDAINAELLRLDDTITRFEDASVAVSAATGTLSEIVHAPAGIVSEVADRVRRAWKDRRRRDGEPHVTLADEPHAELDVGLQSDEGSPRDADDPMSSAI
jgi:hypothetical protein